MPSETSSTAWDSIISRQAVSPPTPPWLAVQVLAHNLARWAARIGLGEQLVTTKTLRRRFFSLAGRLTRSARRLTLHLPRGWPWLSRPLSPWPDCEPSHSQPDGAIRNRPTASKLASARSASASCCVRPHYHAIPSLHRPLSRPGAATENPLRCHIGPNGAQAFSLVGSLIPICPAFTPPIGGFGLMIIDELGSSPGPPPGRNSSSRSFSQRYERGSILVTTNLPSTSGPRSSAQSAPPALCWTVSPTMSISGR